MVPFPRRWQFAVFLVPWLCNAGCEVDSAVLDGETTDFSAPELETDEDSAVGPDLRPELLPGALSARDAGGEFVPLEAIVKFRTATPERPRTNLAGAASSETLARGIHLLRLDTAQRSGLAATDPVGATWAWIEELEADPEVEYAHPNWLFTPSLTPNDPRYPAQWHYPQINLPSAWDLSTGASTVRIAVIDTGRTAHEDLAGRWVPGVEYDAYREDGDASARPGLVWNHGVAVASLVGGRANNGAHTAGVCWNCALLDVNVERGDGFPDLGAVIRGFGWAVDNGARVINASFEADGNCAAADMAGLRDAVGDAIDNGVIVVAAAGNRGLDALNTSPASCSGVISVAATDRNETLAAYSNHTNVTLAAPGGFAAFNGEIARTGKNIDCADDPFSSFDDNEDGVVVDWTTQQGDHCTRHLAGTSLAAPQVTGVVGLMLTRNPRLTPAQVRQILQSTAQKVCGSKCGAGLLDASAAVQKAAPLPPPGDPKPLASFTVQCSGLLCTFDGGNSTDNTGVVAYDWILPGEQFRTGKTVSAYMPGYGLKAARLRVTDGHGQAHEVQKNFTHPQPTVTPVVGQYHSVNRPERPLRPVPHPRRRAGPDLVHVRFAGRADLVQLRHRAQAGRALVPAALPDGLGERRRRVVEDRRMGGARLLDLDRRVVLVAVGRQTGRRALPPAIRRTGPQRRLVRARHARLGHQRPGEQRQARGRSRVPLHLGWGVAAGLDAQRDAAGEQQHPDLADVLHREGAVPVVRRYDPGGAQQPLERLDEAADRRGRDERLGGSRGQVGLHYSEVDRPAEDDPDPHAALIAGPQRPGLFDWLFRTCHFGHV
ncbi:S8 family peptidase [Nannocystis pusilla]|uniref:S8 family peptidase n=1 Tax=Nannocystis pusilla TaxID=889268 RepID=UPI003DA3A3FE